MRSYTVLSLAALLAAVSVQALPVRVAPAATENGQAESSNRPEIFERAPESRQGIADDYPDGVREDGSPQEPKDDTPAADEATSEESTAAYTAMSTDILVSATLNQRDFSTVVAAAQSLGAAALH